MDRAGLAARRLGALVARRPAEPDRPGARLRRARRVPLDTRLPGL